MKEGNNTILCIIASIILIAIAAICIINYDNDFKYENKIAQVENKEVLDSYNG